MMKVELSNEMLQRIIKIEENRHILSRAKIPSLSLNKLRKNSKKKSSYASNKIEGNPLTEEQASLAIEKDEHQHFLKPETEIRNYVLAIDYLSEQLSKRTPFSKKLILKTQALVEKGAAKEKIGLRGAMPPGVLFAVYDSSSGRADYIPPDYGDVPALLDELIEYVNKSSDHPLIKAAITHYQFVTIHPFEDGNGRTARLLSNYVLDYYGYDFLSIGSLEEYFAYDVEEYYASLQMRLPALYYEGRDNPPHPEIWVNYFLRMVELYSSKVLELSASSEEETLKGPLSHLSEKEISFLLFLLESGIETFSPIELSKALGVSNRTIINRSTKLVSVGFLLPVLVKERIRSYRLSDLACENRETLFALLSKARDRKAF